MWTSVCLSVCLTINASTLSDIIRGVSPCLTDDTPWRFMRVPREVNRSPSV